VGPSRSLSSVHLDSVNPQPRIRPDSGPEIVVERDRPVCDPHMVSAGGGRCGQDVRL
jgi:hypothetical protein